MNMFKIILLISVIISFRAVANDDLSWVKGQVISVINNKHNVWTPTDFAIARGDSINSISKIQIVQDVIIKSGIKLPNILNTILRWSK